MYKLAGNFKILSSLMGILFFSLSTWAQVPELVEHDIAPEVVREVASVQSESASWEDFAKLTRLQERDDYRRGLSYIISGSLALVGGLVGDGVASDPAERGIYAVFQTIGIASIGYGAYTWQIGSEERTLYRTLMGSNLSADEKTRFLESYRRQKAVREKKERFIKAITHGLIAGLNFYNASQQEQEGVQTALFFIGGVNALAAVSYTFEF